MYLLDKLWRGDVTPSERYIRPDSEYKKVAKQFCDAADRLQEQLSPEGKNLWEENWPARWFCFRDCPRVTRWK